MGKISMAIINSTWKGLHRCIKYEWKKLNDMERGNLISFAYSMANQMKEALDRDEVF